MDESSTPPASRVDAPAESSWAAAIAEVSSDAREREEARSTEGASTENGRRGPIWALVAAALMGVGLWSMPARVSAPEGLPPEEAREALITALAWTVEDIEESASTAGHLLDAQEVRTLELLPPGWSYRSEGEAYQLQAAEDGLVFVYRSDRDLDAWVDSIRGGGT